MDRSTPGLPVHHQLPEFAQTHSIESVMPSNHLILCRPLLLLPPILPSIRVFSSQLFASGGQSTGVSASASVLPMNTQDLFPLGCTGFDLLAVQGTLKSLLQHHSSKASRNSYLPQSARSSGDPRQMATGTAHGWPVASLQGCQGSLFTCP